MNSDWIGYGANGNAGNSFRGVGGGCIGAGGVGISASSRRARETAGESGGFPARAPDDGGAVAADADAGMLLLGC